MSYIEETMDWCTRTAGRLLLMAVAVALPTFGCTSTRDGLVNSGYTPAYADGYEDGHSSGYFAARGRPRITQDTSRYERESEYRLGWDDGYRVSRWEHASHADRPVDR